MFCRIIAKMSLNLEIQILLQAFIIRVRKKFSKNTIQILKISQNF